MDRELAREKYVSEMASGVAWRKKLSGMGVLFLCGIIMLIICQKSLASGTFDEEEKTKRRDVILPKNILVFSVSKDIQRVLFLS